MDIDAFKVELLDYEKLRGKNCLKLPKLDLKVVLLKSTNAQSLLLPNSKSIIE